MGEAVLKIEDLRKLTGATRAADVKRILEKQGIIVFEGRHGQLWTTASVIELAARVKLGLVTQDNKEPLL